jgi:hypothetical protein
MTYQQAFSKKYKDCNNCTLIYLRNGTDHVVRCIKEWTGKDIDNLDNYIVTRAEIESLHRNTTNDSLAVYLVDKAKRRNPMSNWEFYLKSVTRGMDTSLASELHRHIAEIEKWSKIGDKHLISPEKIAYQLFRGNTIVFKQDTIPTENYKMMSSDLT